MAEQARTAAVTESPEFKAAVDAAVRSATAGIIQQEVAKILDTLKVQGSDVSGSDKRFAETLALAFAQLNEQGNGRKYVDPKILRERGEARERMKEAIIAARREGRVPSYRVVAKTLLDNQVVEPFWVDAAHTAQATEIDWPGVPNDAMVPINETAKEIHDAFLASIGSRPVSVRITADGEFAATVPDSALDSEFGVTPKGLVVKNGAIPDRGRVMQSVQQGEGLGLHHENKPGRAVEKRILGTIAAPARQNV